jgi:hypothetical protein
MTTMEFVIRFKSDVTDSGDRITDSLVTEPSWSRRAHVNYVTPIPLLNPDRLHIPQAPKVIARAPAVIIADWLKSC